MSTDRPAAGDPLPRWLALAGLAALAAWTFWDRWQFAAATPYPTGIDGYWYAVQLRSLLEDGRLYYDASPLALWLMAPLAAAAGPVAGAKLGAALAGAALPLTIYQVGRRVSGERAGGLVAAVLVATSAGSFYLGTEFVKNAVALPIGAGALTALGWALERPSPRRLAAPAALALAALLSHTLVFALVLAASIGPVALALCERGRARIAWLAGAAALALAVLLAIAKASGLAGLFTGDPDWSLPALRLGERALLFRREVALGGAAGLLAIAAALLARRLPSLAPPSPLGDQALAWGPSLWAIAIALPWLATTDPEGLAFRLRVMAFAPLAIAAALATAALGARLSPMARMTTLMLLSGLALYRPGPYRAPVVQVHPDLAEAVASARGLIPAGDIIISPERHIVFMSTWYTRVETRLHPDEIPPERRWRLLPMAYQSQNLSRAINDARRQPDLPPPISLHAGHPNGLVLLREATWQWVLTHLEGPERAHYQSWPTY